MNDILVYSGSTKTKNDVPTFPNLDDRSSYLEL